VAKGNEKTIATEILIAKELMSGSEQASETGHPEN